MHNTLKIITILIFTLLMQNVVMKLVLCSMNSDDVVPVTYDVEISGRSNSHAIDQFVLFKTDKTLYKAITEAWR